MTPPEFYALGKRRSAAIRYARYANSITAAAVYNVNRANEDAPVVSAFDFIRDEASAKKLERLREAKQYIKKVIGNVPWDTPMERLQDIRLKVIADLAASGYSDAEGLFNSVWPHLIPIVES
jgi:hypothetical protein